MSRIETMPPDIKARLDAMLREGVDQAEILRRLEDPMIEAGERPISKAGLNRYATKMADFDADFRDMNAVAEVFVSKYGDRPMGDVSQLTQQVLVTTIFRVAERVRKAVKGEADDGAIDMKELGQLVLAAQRMERSLGLAVKREKELREAHERQKQALAKVDAAAKEAEGGADPLDVIRRIEQEVYGIFEADA